MDWRLNRSIVVTEPSTVYSPKSFDASDGYGHGPPTAFGKPSPPPSMTTSSRSLSFGSISSHHKAIKYGKGKHSDVELIPQPSDDSDDPLNWPRWRKDLNLVSLFMTVGLVGSMKTAFVATSGVMAAQYRVSYTAVAALTAVPVMLSALTGLASLVAAKLWGKRPVYLASAVPLLVGSIWNAAAGDSYGSCMGARISQGLGWGAFDTLVMATIQDTYFEHERNLPVSLYNVFTIAMTLGSPLVGGVVSSNAGSFTVQFRIISSLFVVAILLLALGAPETAFDRSMASVSLLPMPGLEGSPPWRPWRLRHKFNRDNAAQYLKSVRPLSFRGPMTLFTALQAPRALIAPTTCLLALLSFIPHGTLWGFTTSIALLTTPRPLALSPAGIGALMAGPCILATLIVGGFCFYRGFYQKFTRQISYTVIAAGTFIVLIGLLSFGLGVYNYMRHGSATPGAMPFFSPQAASQLSLPLLSFQLGILASGLYVLDASTRPLIARSASFTSSNIVVAHRSIGDMHAGVVVIRNLTAGIFIATTPGAVAYAAGLRAVAIGFAATQVVIAAAAVTLWWFLDEEIWKADGKIMGLVDLRLLK